MVYGTFEAKVVLNYLTDRHCCNQRKQYEPLTAAVMAEVVCWLRRKTVVAVKLRRFKDLGRVTLLCC